MSAWLSDRYEFLHVLCIFNFMKYSDALGNGKVNSLTLKVIINYDCEVMRWACKLNDMFSCHHTFIGFAVQSVRDW